MSEQLRPFTPYELADQDSVQPIWTSPGCERNLHMDCPGCDCPCHYRAQTAELPVGLFLEYRDVHGYDEADARSAAALEVAEGAAVTDADLGP